MTYTYRAGSMLTKVHNTEGMHGSVLDDESITSILSNGETAIAEIVNTECRKRIKVLSPKKRAYLLENMNIGQVPAAYKKLYEDIMLENQDVFAEDKYDLGWSDAVTHRINMKHSRPVYVKQFPIPEASAAAIEDQRSSYRSMFWKSAQALTTLPYLQSQKREGASTSFRISGKSIKHLTLINMLSATYANASKPSASQGPQCSPPWISHQGFGNNI